MAAALSGRVVGNDMLSRVWRKVKGEEIAALKPHFDGLSTEGLLAD